MDADNSGNLDASDHQTSSREGELVDFAIDSLSKLKVIVLFAVELSHSNVLKTAYSGVTRRKNV